jgi:drug/metabolite transporter (DMT)-like permease
MLIFQIMHGLFTEHVAHGILSGLMWSAAAFELSTYAVLSALELRLSRASVCFSSLPLVDYSAIALCISLGRGLTWVGYGTLSYPTVVIFKSSKILVVMLSGILILNKRFRPAQYLAGILVVLGLCTISAADRGSHGAGAGAVGDDSLGGIAVTCAAVVFEATVSNMQERALRRERRPLAEMILVTNALGAGLLFAVAAGRGELRLLAAKVEREPAALAWLFSTVSLAYGCVVAPAPPPASTLFSA